MRGIPSLITDIRKKVFTEVARMAYAGGDYSHAEDLPYIIVPGDQPLHRESVFLERAIAGERVRLAMGLGVRPVQTRSLMTDGMDAAAVAEQYYEPPLINIIPYACHACPTNQYRVTESCQNCLAASCQKVCPKGAISFVNGKSHIDPEKCIKCGKCAKACPYHAIIHLERPCQAACGMDAIGSDEHHRAVINQDKCVSCGQCLVSCPFGAIVDKGQIFQVIQSILKGDKVIAIVAPAFIGQFGKHSTPGKFIAAMKRLGFARIVEVAVRRVAVGGGACGEFEDDAIRAGCDTYVTADLSYHQFLDAAGKGINLIDAGHFPTEDPVCEKVIMYLTDRFPELAVTKSASHREVIQYYVEGE